MQGVKVERILPGGRLAEIVVEGKSNGEGLMIMASNVATFSVDACAWIKSNETMSISVGLKTCTSTWKQPLFLRLKTLIISDIMCILYVYNMI